MQRIIFIAVAVLLIGLGIYALVTAQQDSTDTQSQDERTQTEQTDSSDPEPTTTIDSIDVPQSVTSSIESTYPDFRIESVSQNEQDGDTSYRISLVNETTGATLALSYDAEWNKTDTDSEATGGGAK